MEYLPNKKKEIVLQASGRLDRVLKKSFGSGSEWLSGKAWDYLFDHKKILDKNAKAKKAGDTAKEGDLISIEFPSTNIGLLPSTKSNIASSLVYLDPEKRFFVWNKNVQIPSLPQLPWESNSAVNEAYAWARSVALGDAFLNLLEAPVLEAGLVQRLDTDTSGLMIFALTKEAKVLFRQLISKHHLEKTYLVLVKGEWALNQEEFSFILNLSSSKKVRVVKAAQADEKEEKVSLNIKCLQKNSKASLLQVKTSYGARHIVRVVLSHLGYPLVGDKLYGNENKDSLPAFHQLHASGLQLKKYASPFSILEVGLSVTPPMSFMQNLKDFDLSYE